MAMNIRLLNLNLNKEVNFNVDCNKPITIKRNLKDSIAVEDVWFFNNELLINDKLVSTIHAEICVFIELDAKFGVRDLGSRNGSFINDVILSHSNSLLVSLQSKNSLITPILHIKSETGYNYDIVHIDDILVFGNTKLKLIEIQKHSVEIDNSFDRNNSVKDDESATLDGVASANIADILYDGDANNTSSTDIANTQDSSIIREFNYLLYDASNPPFETNKLETILINEAVVCTTEIENNKENANLHNLISNDQLPNEECLSSTISQLNNVLLKNTEIFDENLTSRPHLQEEKDNGIIVLSSDCGSTPEKLKSLRYCSSNKISILNIENEEFACVTKLMTTTKIEEQKVTLNLKHDQELSENRIENIETSNVRNNKTNSNCGDLKSLIAKRRKLQELSSNTKNRSSSVVHPINSSNNSRKKKKTIKNNQLEVSNIVKTSEEIHRRIADIDFEISLLKDRKAALNALLDTKLEEYSLCKHAVLNASCTVDCEISKISNSLLNE